MYKADYQGTYGFLCLYVVHSVFWILFDPGFRLESCLAHQFGDWHSFGDFEDNLVKFPVTLWMIFWGLNIMMKNIFLCYTIFQFF